jgi:hypothetical protein
MIRGTQPRLDLDYRSPRGVGLTLSRREFLMFGVATGALLVGGRAFGASRDLTSLSLQKASDGVRRKSVSPVELTQACLSPIEKFNPILNAYITLTGGRPPTGSMADDAAEGP